MTNNLNNEWYHTGETETGLQIWIKENQDDGERYLQYKFVNNEGKILVNETISFKKIELINSLLSSLKMLNGN